MVESIHASGGDSNAEANPEKAPNNIANIANKDEESKVS